MLSKGKVERQKIPGFSATGVQSLEEKFPMAENDPRFLRQILFPLSVDAGGDRVYAAPNGRGYSFTFRGR